MGVYSGMKFPKEQKWHTRSALVKWALGTFLVGLLLGMAVGVANADWTGRTKNYQTETIQFFYPNGSDVAVPECPIGWKYEAYVRMPDTDNPPAFVPVLLLKGECPHGRK